MEQNQSLKTWLEKNGINGSVLKFIAMLTMFIDHAGAGIVGRYRMMMAQGLLDVSKLPMADFWVFDGGFTIVYGVMRGIGRIAFPIYCFLLVEGFEHTRNRWHYLWRLMLFAAISEVPFDLLLKGRILEFSHQNVFFTLSMGLLAMMGYEWMVEQAQWPLEQRQVVALAVVAAGVLLGWWLHVDYAKAGVLCIMIQYVCRRQRLLQTIAGAASFLWEKYAPLAFVFVGLYNGKRGKQRKYFYYFFYPVHLLLLYAVCIVLGIQGVEPW